MDETKKQFSTNTTEWNDSIEKVLRDMGKSCRIYKWVSLDLANRLSLKYDALIYTNIVIGPIAGILSSFDSCSDGEDTKTQTIKIFVTIFAFLTGIFTAVIKFGKFNQKATSSQSLGAKFASLEGNILRQLSLDRKDRVNPGQYLEYISKSYDELYSITPVVPEEIYQSWVEYTKTQDNDVLNSPRTSRAQSSADSQPPSPLVVTRVTTPEQGVNSGDNTIPEPHQEESPIEIVVKGTDTVRGLPEINQYSQDRMKYELSRLQFMGKV